MFVDGVYSYNDKIIQKEIEKVSLFVNEHYSLREYDYDTMYQSMTIRGSKTYIRYNQDEGISDILILHKNIETGCIYISLLVGISSDVFVFAFGVVMYELLNSGLGAVEFFVHKDNQHMLDITIKQAPPEYILNSETHRKFKISATDFILKYRKFYHRFILNIDNNSQITDISILYNTICVNTGSFRRKNLFAWRKNHYYIKNADTSIHASSEIVNLMYPSHEHEYSIDFSNHFSEEYADVDPIDDAYFPTTAFILPTRSCNLRCKYCYSEATPEKDSVLKYEDGIVAIDFILSNTSVNKKATIIFHGGGEPTLCLDLISNLVKYGRDKAIKENKSIVFSISTNGTLLSDKLLHLYSFFDSIQFSFDGLENTQNTHRPFADNKKSFNVVVKNIKKIRNTYPNLRIAIRSTVSQNSLYEMPDFVRFCHSLGANKVVFEPLMVTGRALYNTDLSAPLIEEFVRYYKEASIVAKQMPIGIGCSAESLYRECNFCGASNSNFVLTPTGHISTCVEVSDVSDPLSSLFVIGACDGGKVAINKDKLRQIRQRGRQTEPECSFCIAEKSCRGNCLSHVIRYADAAGSFMINPLCLMQTNLFIDKLHRLHISKEKRSMSDN